MEKSAIKKLSKNRFFRNTFTKNVKIVTKRDLDFYFAWDQIASFGIAKINLTLTVEQQNFLQISLEQAQLRKSSMLQQNVLLQQFR